MLYPCCCMWWLHFVPIHMVEFLKEADAIRSFYATQAGACWFTTQINHRQSGYGICCKRNKPILTLNQQQNIIYKMNNQYVFFSKKRLVENPQHATTESFQLETWQIAEYWIIEYLAKCFSHTIMAGAWWCTSVLLKSSGTTADIGYAARETKPDWPLMSSGRVSRSPWGAHSQFDADLTSRLGDVAWQWNGRESWECVVMLMRWCGGVVGIVWWCGEDDDVSHCGCEFHMMQYVL